MPRYISLINWTDQGAKNYKETVDRYEAVAQAGTAFGVKFTEIFWTLGSYDIVAVIEAPDEESLTASLLAAGERGSIRSTTMRAFDAGEMRGIVAKAG